MNLEEKKQFMKDFFEKYYESEKQFCRRPIVDKEMLVNPDENDIASNATSWKYWKLVESNLTFSNLKEIEEDLNIEFPEILKVFFTTYFHYFDNPIGSNPYNAPLSGFFKAVNPILIKNGYLPFSWDEEDYYINCINLNNMPDDEKCQICKINHEVLFRFDENTTKEEINEKMKYIADNFYDFLKGLLEKNEEDIDYEFYSDITNFDDNVKDLILQQQSLLKTIKENTKDKVELSLKEDGKILITDDQYFSIMYVEKIQQYFLCVMVNWIVWYNRYYIIDENDYNLYVNNREKFIEKFDKVINQKIGNYLLSGSSALRDYCIKKGLDSEDSNNTNCFRGHIWWKGILWANICWKNEYYLCLPNIKINDEFIKEYNLSNIYDDDNNDVLYGVKLK